MSTTQTNREARPPALRQFPDYRAAITVFFEEEVAGETYFARLAEFFAGRPRRALELLAEIERLMIVAMQPLLDRNRIAPDDMAALRLDGRREADGLRGQSWENLIAGMRSSLPVFIEECAAVERLAPPEDLPVVRLVTGHEVAALEFAEREATGDPGSLEPLERFLAELRSLARG